jgi:hypothetical protein
MVPPFPPFSLFMLESSEISCSYFSKERELFVAMTLLFIALIQLLRSVASQNTTYRADGRCGSGYGNAPCDPLLSGACCSISGYVDYRLRFRPL